MIKNKKQDYIKLFLILFILSFLSISNVYASILINGNYGEIFPAKNGNMHILIRNKNSSYVYYFTDGIVKDVPLGVSDSTIIFETASSDVYVFKVNWTSFTVS